MKSLNGRYYEVWDDSDSTIQANRGIYAILAQRTMCTDNWILRIWKDKEEKPFINEEINLVSSGTVRNRINDIFKELKNKKKQ